MEQSNRTLLVLVCAILLPIPRLAAQSLLEPVDEYVELAELTSPLSTSELTEIALAFSDVPRSERDRYHTAIETLLVGAHEEIRTDDPYEIAEELLQYLHETVLGRYSEPQTRLDVLLDDGRFNCVSSAVIYLISARSFGLDVSGTVTPDHAFCTIRIDGEVVDVETTTMHGFDPGRRTEFHDSFGNLTGYSYVPPGKYSLRDEADERELLSFILHNRISTYDLRNQFEDALRTSVNRHTFLESDETFADVVREIGNYLAVLNTRRQYPEALEFIDRVQARFGRIDALRTVSYSILHNRVISLLESSAFDDAWSLVLEHDSLWYVSESQSIDLRQMVVQYDLARTLPALGIDEAFEYLARRTRESSLPDDTFTEYHILLFSKLAEQEATDGDYLSASYIVDDAITVVGRDSRLVRAREVYRYNYAALVHNRFADAFNERNLALARNLVRDALAHVPESTLLANDLEMVDRAIEQAER